MEVPDLPVGALTWGADDGPLALPRPGRLLPAPCTHALDLHTALGGDSRALLLGHDRAPMTACGAVHSRPNCSRIVAMSVPPRQTLERGGRGRGAVRRGLR